MMNQLLYIKVKNTILFSTIFISNLNILFIGSEERVDWYLLIDYTRRIDFAVFYYSITINSIIMAYCLNWPKGVSKDLTRFLFILCVLDLVHMITISKLYFGFSKIFICLIIYFFKTAYLYVVSLFNRYSND